MTFETFHKCPKHEVQYPQGAHCPACKRESATSTSLEVLDKFQAEIDSIKDRGVVTIGLVQEWLGRLRKSLETSSG